MTTREASPFLSTTEAGRLLHYDDSTIRRMVASGTLRAERPGRKVLVYRCDVERLLNGGAEPETNEELNAEVQKLRALVAEMNVVLARIKA